MIQIFVDNEFKWNESHNLFSQLTFTIIKF
jgi:hypothetical protein